MFLSVASIIAEVAAKMRNVRKSAEMCAPDLIRNESRLYR